MLPVCAFDAVSMAYAAGPPRPTSVAARAIAVTPLRMRPAIMTRKIEAAAPTARAYRSQGRKLDEVPSRWMSHQAVTAIRKLATPREVHVSRLRHSSRAVMAMTPAMPGARATV